MTLIAQEQIIPGNTIGSILGAPIQTPPHSLFTEKQLDQLKAKLNPELIADRQGMSYIEGHVAIRHALEIFGYGNFVRGLPKLEVVDDITYPKRDKQGQIQKTDDGREIMMFRVGYTCTVSVSVRSPITGEWVTSYGTGFGEGITSESRGKAHESAIKEAETDAMKRALVLFGDQFALTLYDKQRRNVGHDDNAPEIFVDEIPSATELHSIITALSNAKKLKVNPMVKGKLTALGKEKLVELSEDELKQLYREIKPHL